jgi:hypothetical protein
MSRREPYRQHLPALDLSIERFTEAVPHDGRWYLLRAGDELGSFRTLNEAKRAWADVLDQAGWKPPERQVNAQQAMKREAAERWSRNRAG